MMPSPDISVAIPTYNRSEVLIDTIHDVLKQSYKNLELIVVDQTKKHDPEVQSALDLIKDPRYRYFKTAPPSLPAARNFALNVARAPIVLFLDDDVKLKKNMVAEHLKALEKYPEISAVAGRVMQTGFPIKKEVLRFDDYAVSRGVFTATDAGYTNTFPGGNHSIRVKDALAVGGYETRYRGNAFREESDLAFRLVRHGMKIYYEPRAELLHLAAPSGGLRISGHIYDSKTFYKNEMFFTIRAVKFYRLPKAILKKYLEYCKPGRKIMLKRSLYFTAGLLTAFWWIVFGKKIVQREVK